MIDEPNHILTTYFEPIFLVLMHFINFWRPFFSKKGDVAFWHPPPLLSKIGQTPSPPPQTPTTSFPNGPLTGLMFLKMVNNCYMLPNSKTLNFPENSWEKTFKANVTKISANKKLQLKFKTLFAIKSYLFGYLLPFFSWAKITTFLIHKRYIKTLSLREAEIMIISGTLGVSTTKNTNKKTVAFKYVPFLRNENFMLLSGTKAQIQNYKNFSPPPQFWGESLKKWEHNDKYR